MTTIKSYTDIEQSKKLAEILPLESADMFCADVFNKEEGTHSYNFHILSTWGCNTFEELKDRENKFVHFIPCWSLAALLNYLKSKNKFPEIKELSDGRFKLTTYIWNGEDCIQVSIGDTIVDACYEMILKLHKLTIL